MPDLSTSAPIARPVLDVLLANPRGFCAGVRRAIAAVEAALERHGPPVYVRRPIVHNMAVVRALEAKGAVFVRELDEVPEGARVVLSAHGVPPAVIADADARRLLWLDATCPLVDKVHREVRRHHAERRHVILIGHEGHPEVEGTVGQVPEGTVSVVNSPAAVRALPLDAEGPVAYALQTTYAQDEAGAIVAAIGERFGDVAAPPTTDICYATSNRQAAVKALAPAVDAVIVAGDAFSSNAMRLVEVARAAGCASVQLAAMASDIDWAALGAPRRLGLTAAASAPESVVEEILDALRARFFVQVEERPGRAERTVFRPVRVA